MKKEKNAAPRSHDKMKATPGVFAGIAGLPGPAAAEAKTESIVSLLGEIQGEC